MTRVTPNSRERISEVKPYNEIKWEDAGCSGIGESVFFLGAGESKTYNPMLREICGRCEILEDCRNWAVAHEKYGFQGGMSGYERKIYREKHGIVYEDPSLVAWAQNLGLGEEY